MFTFVKPYLALSVFTLSLALLSSGCGGPAGPNPDRYDVSGTVTFDGKPVPFGSMTFTPDSSEGNKGPQGVVQIRDGKFNTAEAGRAPIGGPHIITISGTATEGNAEDEMAKQPEPLFPEYTTNVDLPKSVSTQDFKIPKTEK